MEQIITFIGNHPILASLFVISSIWLILSEFLFQVRAPKISIQQTINTLNRNKTSVLIDIRDEKEFSKEHILGAINIPLAKLTNNMNNLKKYKSKTVIIACQNGLTGNKAVQYLNQNGSGQVFLMIGGINAWKQQNLPLNRV